MERQSRTSRKQPNLIEPIDVTKFGSNEDPCFGKLFSLTADECLVCGDSSLCLIVFQNNQTRKRLNEEKKLKPLDLKLDKLEWEKDITDYIKKLKRGGVKGLLLRKRIKDRFHINDERIKQYLKWVEQLNTNRG